MPEIWRPGYRRNLPKTLASCIDNRTQSLDAKHVRGEAVARRENRAPFAGLEL